MSKKTSTTDNDGHDGPLSDEERRKLLKPAPTKEQVLEILKTSYVIAKNTASTSNSIPSVEVVKQLDSYDDVNYLVKIDNVPYLLKIHNGVESQEFLQVYHRDDEAGGGGGDYYKPGHMNSAIHLQNAIMVLLSRHGIVTSSPISPTISSSSSSTSSSPPPPLVIHSLPVASSSSGPPDNSSPTQQELVVRLLKWVPGRTMSSVQVMPLETLADAGRYLGKMDRILDKFNTVTTATTKIEDDKTADNMKQDHSKAATESDDKPGHHKRVLSSWMEKLQPNDDNDDDDDDTAKNAVAALYTDESLWIPARRYHQWDGKNTLDVRDFVDCIEDTKRRALITSILQTFDQELIQSGVAEQFRKGLNHADFNDANIVLDNDFKVSGVLDFGDSVESWRVLDVTTAMAYGMVSTYGKSNRGISAAAAVLRGYNSIYPLTSLEREHLVLLVACRLACSATLGAYAYSQNPGNKYLLLHAEPAWKMLEMMWCGGNSSDAAQQRMQIKAAMNRVFDQACLYHDSHDDDTVIQCFDLVSPDPPVMDLLSSVRVSSSGSSTEPPTKKLKTADDDNDDTSTKLPVVTFVTGNAKKLEEVKRILGSNGSSATNELPIHLVNQKLDLPELQGEALEIAREKCLLASKEVGGGAVIIEDTSLCFNALNGLPGPYIKWFLDSCGHDGLNRMLAGFDDQTAYAQTVVAYCPGTTTNADGVTTTTIADPAIFSGRTNGTIVPARGKLDFGWDPIFEPLEQVDDSAKKTYAEMTKDEKDAISHRSRAFAQLREYLGGLHGDENK